MPCDLNSHEPEAGLMLTAYRIRRYTLDLKPFLVNPDLLEAASQRFANPCVPLLIANPAGWVNRKAEVIEATFYGGDQVEGAEVVFSGQHPALVSVSHFGHAVLTRPIIWLFRSPTGYNLAVRGQANWCKDGIYPLDGIVETNRKVATCTRLWMMKRNWRKLRRGL